MSYNTDHAIATRIAKRAAKQTEISIIDLAGPSREGNLPRIRYVVWLAMEEAGITRKVIAGLFARDISSVAVGIKKAIKLRDNSMRYSRLIKSISEKRSASNSAKQK